MSPRSITELVRREPVLLGADMTVRDAVVKLIDAKLPALPVVSESDRLVGIFGEREFITALFPAYLASLGYAGFIPRSIEAAIKKRAACGDEPVSKYMTTEHVEVPADHADVQLAEIFLHHRVLIVPVTEAGRVVGVVTRSDFFTTLGQQFLGESGSNAI